MGSIVVEVTDPGQVDLPLFVTILEEIEVVHAEVSVLFDDLDEGISSNENPWNGRFDGCRTVASSSPRRCDSTSESSSSIAVRRIRTREVAGLYRSSVDIPEGYSLTPGIWILRQRTYTGGVLSVQRTSRSAPVASPFNRPVCRRRSM